MKVNKTVLLGVILIILSGIIFTSDILNPFIRPITYLFLMGSSKGKDIMFFGLFGLFLILSQATSKDIDTTKYLKISIAVGSLLLILGIVLEIIFRLQMGIGLNTVFFSMTKSISSTSIMHTHLLKSILGEFLTHIIGPFIQSDINTGVGLYDYLPNFAFLVILLIPILFTTIVLSSQKRTWVVNLILAYASSCLIIGAIDGGLFATPSIIGIFGLYFVYLNEFNINYGFGMLLKDDTLLDYSKTHTAVYKNQKSLFKRIVANKFSIIFLVVIFILLRFTVAFAGAETEYYTVEIENIDDNVDFGNITLTHINGAIYHADASYNEMELINSLKIPLNNSCDYYTVSWNMYSYFEDESWKKSILFYLF